MACCGGAHIWNVIHITKDFLIFKNIYWRPLLGGHLPFVITQQLDTSLIRTTGSSLMHRTLQKRQKKPTPLADCIVWGRKKAKTMHLYFLVEYASFCQWIVCPRDILSSKWIFRLGHFSIDVRDMMEVWKVKQTKNMCVHVSLEIFSVSVCAQGAVQNGECLTNVSK